MMFENTVPEIIAGVAVEIALAGLVGTVLYRLFSGRFLIPKREIILPNQCGVIVQGDAVIRVAGAGTCWIRPKQRMVLIDLRPKPLQVAGIEVLGRDNGVVRISLSAEYKVHDPAVYYSNSANAAEALFVQLRRVLNVSAREQPALALTADPEAFGTRLRSTLEEPAKRLGLVLAQLDIYEAVPLGVLRVPESASYEFPDSGLVH